MQKRTPRPLRALGVAAVAVLMVLGLSSCNTKVGQAAVVQGHRLSDSDLEGYLKPTAKAYTDSNNATVIPKLYVLENWIDDELFERTVESRGGRVTAAELTKTRGLVLGSGSLSDVSTYYGKLGYTNRFVSLFLHEQQMIVLLVKRLAPNVAEAQIIPALQSGRLTASLLAAVRSAKLKVSVSPRYGSWNASRLSLTQTRGAGLPSFIKFLPGDASGSASIPPTTG
jgi:hypothetical protein